MSSTLGDRIKEVRLKDGYTMEKFGELLNTSKGTVNNWEKGRNEPNRENLKKIAEIGFVSIDYLLNGSLDILGNEMPVSKFSLYDYKIIKTRTTKIKESQNLSMIVLIKLYNNNDIQASFLNCRMICNNELEVTEIHIDDIRYFDYVDLQPDDKEGQELYYKNIRLKKIDDIVTFSDYRRLKKRVLKNFDSIFFQKIYDETIKEKVGTTQILKKYRISPNLKLYYIEDDYKFNLIDITV